MYSASVSDDYWSPADDADGGDASAACVSVSGSEWVALMKIASGDWSIPASELECLLERTLIEKIRGVPMLTRLGRLALGLPV